MAALLATLRALHFEFGFFFSSQKIVSGFASFTKVSMSGIGASGRSFFFLFFSCRVFFPVRQV